MNLVLWVAGGRGRPGTPGISSNVLSGKHAGVGEGNLNWSSILPALYRTGTEWVVVEQDDCYGEDPYECLRRSYNNMNALLAKN